MAIAGAVVLLFFIFLAVFGNLITPESYDGYNPVNVNVPPQLDYRYLFGSDPYGHAIIMYVITGARVSLEVGVLAALLASIIGVLVGATAGYFGGMMDSVCMRITDVFLTLPFLPLLVLLSAYLGGKGGVPFIILVLGLLGWTSVARLIRSYYLTLRQQEFTESARAVGVSDARIIFRHILPNALSPVIVSFTLLVAAFIVTEAAIDFLGVGLKSPTVSWESPWRAPRMPS